MMAGIRSGNTKPELIIRKALHRLGLRYTLHSKHVPGGKPDLAFPSRRAAIFVHGCFWHGHDCRFFKMPSTRPEFWTAKITANRKRDTAVAEKLEQAGWRQLTIWECAIRGKRPEYIANVVMRSDRWVRSGRSSMEIRG
jgi:DNA mismatch endonuclease (patch repair protein)